MLRTLIGWIWNVNRFLYLHNMSRARKLYTQTLLAEKIAEIKDIDTTEDTSLHSFKNEFLNRAEEFLVWAKENEQVPSVWGRLFISIYIVYVKLDLFLCKIFYIYFSDEYEKIHFRNAIADLIKECKASDLDISKIKLEYLNTYYKWMCDRQ